MNLTQIRRKYSELSFHLDVHFGATLGELIVIVSVVIATVVCIFVGIGWMSEDIARIEDLEQTCERRGGVYHEGRCWRSELFLEG